MQIDLAKDKTYLLACSYGPDSMVLFNLLLMGEYNFKVAHVNYQMRGTESDEETTALTAFCKKNNIPLFKKLVDGKLLPGNFQRAAREVRYNFFKEVMDQEKLDVLLTAHHADDHLETYLMQKVSKRSTFHYGIKHETVINGMTVTRPLLAYFKDEILAYATKHNVPYSVDSSNESLTYMRNKIRHKQLKNSTFAAKMNLIDEIATLNEILLQTETDLQKMINGNAVAIKDYELLANAERTYLVYLLFKNVGIPLKFSKAQVIHFEDVIKTTQNSLMHRIYKNVYLVKYEDNVKLFDISLYEPYSYKIDKPTTLKTPHFTVYLDKDEVLPAISISEYPLFITSPILSDTYTIKGYQKPLNRLFIDMKLPRHYRFFWPIVKNKNGKVIYVPRYRQGYVPKKSDLFRINTN